MTYTCPESKDSGHMSDTSLSLLVLKQTTNAVPKLLYKLAVDRHLKGRPPGTPMFYVL